MIQADAAAKRAGPIALERGGTRLTLRDMSTYLVAEFYGANWLVGEVRAKRVSIEGKQVIGSQQPAIADHASDRTVDAILSSRRAHGLIAA